MRKIVWVSGWVCVSLLVLAFGSVGVSLALENQDTFCAVCHTEPESQYVNQAAQATATTLAAFHSSKHIACIDCHSGSGTFGRLEGLTQGFNDLAMFLSGNYHKPAITTSPLNDAACGKCHADVVNPKNTRGNNGSNGHYHLYLPQWQASDPKAAHCATCHTAHTSGLASLQFMAQGKVGQLCEACHTALSGRVQ